MQRRIVDLEARMEALLMEVGSGGVRSGLKIRPRWCLIRVGGQG